MQNQHRIYLNLRHLSALDQLAWLNLAAFVAGHHPAAFVVVDIGSLKPELRNDETISAFREWGRDLQLTDAGAPPVEPIEQFAYLTGSEVLSRKLVMSFPTIYVEPSRPPQCVESQVYWEAAATGHFGERLTKLVERVGPASSTGAAQSYAAQLRPANRQVTLLTSIFNGDDYLEAFLRNMGELEGYAQSEHFLVRAGSQGEEHVRLLAHVQSWPCAVYVNLPKDPGLYEVWNLGARLSTARYLSSANLDDRRAPTHLRKTTTLLNNDDSVQVASTALRITETKNLDWRLAAHCSTWFGSRVETTYQVDTLLRRKGDRLVPRNIPHCMPVWRRELHALHGYFREREYGPSADWEFWLRVGTAGAGFAHVAEPLGLYLKSEHSYWHREPAARRYEDRIVSDYAPDPADTAARDDNVHRPSALAIAELRALFATGAFAELVGRLFDQARKLSNLDRGKTLYKLLEQLGAHYVGIIGILEWAGRHPRRAVSSSPNASELLTTIIDLLHAGHGTRAEPKGSVPATVLAGALMDLYTLTVDMRALIARAFLFRRQGDLQSEGRLLRSAHRTDSRSFWFALQGAYRFEVALDQIAALLNSVEANPAAGSHRPLNLTYYPDFTQYNTYQTLLYGDVVEAGGRVHGIEHLDDLVELDYRDGYLNVLHIHWISALFRDVTTEDFASHAHAVVDRLRAFKSRGFRIYWTVHNSMSHNTVNEQAERHFRQQLLELADRVYVHHPVIPHLLDWMPDATPVHLVEHGNYIQRNHNLPDPEAARAALNLARQDLVLVSMGQFRGYKAFNRFCPTLSKFLLSNPRLKLILAGKFASRVGRKHLPGVPADQLILRDGVLPEAELERIVRAGDFVFLSYRDVLTSGSLFHAFSLGLPVIAPAFGTIPAYVVDGWNGFLYRDRNELEQILNACLRCTKAFQDELARNAYRTAEQLRWNFI